MPRGAWTSSGSRRTLALALLAALIAAWALLAPGTGRAGFAECPPWQMRTVASDLGALENLVFDRRGHLLVSASTQDAILSLDRNGDAETLIPDVNAPGGLRIRNHVLYFNTGDSANSGVNNIPDGTIDRYRFATGKRTTWAKRLTMPNGLVLLPDGDALTSRDLGDTTGITRVHADDPKHPETNWADVPDSNGMAVSQSQRWLYYVETFNAQAPVYRIRIERPSRIELVASLGESGFKALDDMTRARDSDMLFVAANISGEIFQVDPESGDSCVIASGLQNPSSLKFGRGPGWPSENLYVTGFDGTVRELTPP